MAAIVRALSLGITVSSVLFAAVLLTSGCTPSPSTTVDRTPESEEVVLTPQQRGESRREALQAARAGWDAFETNDAEGVREHFEPSLADAFVERIEGYATEGRQRQREYEVNYFDVTKLSADGNVATVSIRVIDNAYFIEPDGTRTEPYGEERGVELTLTREAGGEFLVTSFTSVSAFLE